MLAKRQAVACALLFVLVSASILLPLSAADSDRGKGKGQDRRRQPHGRADPPGLRLENGFMKAVFEGKQPKINFAYNFTEPAAQNVTLAFQVNFKRLIEVSPSELIEPVRQAVFELESAEWIQSPFYTIYREGSAVGVGINFTSTGYIHVAGLKGKQPTTVLIVAQMYNDTIPGIPSLVEGQVAVKVDIAVINWRWKQPGDLLALEVEYGVHNMTNVGPRTRLSIVGGVSSGTTLPPGQGTSFQVRSGDKIVAYLDFGQPAFDITGREGAEPYRVRSDWTTAPMVTMTPEYKVEGGHARIFIKYGHFGNDAKGSLYQDPAFGINQAIAEDVSLITPPQIGAIEVGGTSVPVLLISAAVATAIIAAVVVAAARRGIELLAGARVARTVRLRAV